MVELEAGLKVKNSGLVIGVGRPPLLVGRVLNGPPHLEYDECKRWAGYPAVPEYPAGYTVIRQEKAGYISGKACRIIRPDIRHPVRKTRSGLNLEFTNQELI